MIYIYGRARVFSSGLYLVDEQFCLAGAKFFKLVNSHMSWSAEDPHARVQKITKLFSHPISRLKIYI